MDGPTVQNLWNHHWPHSPQKKIRLCEFFFVKLKLCLSPTEPKWADPSTISFTNNYMYWMCEVKWSETLMAIQLVAVWFMPTRSSPTKSTPTRLTPARSTPTRSTPNKRNVTVFESMCMGCHMSQNEKIKGYLYIHYGIYKSTTGFIYPARYSAPEQESQLCSF